MLRILGAERILLLEAHHPIERASVAETLGVVERYRIVAHDADAGSDDLCVTAQQQAVCESTATHWTLPS